MIGRAAAAVWLPIAAGQPLEAAEEGFSLRPLGHLIVSVVGAGEQDPSGAQFAGHVDGVTQGVGDEGVALGADPEDHVVAELGVEGDAPR